MYYSIVDPTILIAAGGWFIAQTEPWGHSYWELNDPEIKLEPGKLPLCKFEHYVGSADYNKLLMHPDVFSGSGDIRIQRIIKFKYKNVRYHFDLIIYANIPEDDLKMLLDAGVIHASSHAMYACSIR